MNENENATNNKTPRPARTDRAWRRQERKAIKAMAAAPARDKHEGKKRRRSIAYADYSGSTPTQALQRVSRLQALERFFGRRNHAQRLRAFFNHREAVLRASAATDDFGVRDAHGLVGRRVETNPDDQFVYPEEG